MARTRKRRVATALAFDAIAVEGSLISPAMLARIAQHEADGQSTADYGIPKGLTLRDEIARYFRIAQAQFAELTASKTPSLGATVAFVEGLLRDVFGFAEVVRVGNRTEGDRQFPVTLECLGRRVPVVVVPPQDDLDRPSDHLPTDGRRRSAASSVQDWLNASDEALWLHYASTTARGDVWVGGASGSGPWFLSLDHRGVAAEIGPATDSSIRGPGIATFELATLHDLHAALDRVYKLAVSLPDAPLERFRAETAGLPRTTEAERLVIQRVGQDVFRDALMDYWGGRCPITGITEPALLRASHIVPWSECTDEQRLDVHNGLLLSALWDAAFDRGLVSFADDGTVLASEKLSITARSVLGVTTMRPLRGLREGHRVNLAQHRLRHDFREPGRGE